MSEKLFNARIVHKHDTEANWLKAVNFTPKQGEIIVYDIDDNYNYERFKIGDGASNVNDLPFYAGSWNDLSNKPFGEETTIIKWNGEIEDRVYVTLQDRNGIRTDIVKIAPPIDKNDLVGATISMSSGSSMAVTDNSVRITEDGNIANCADVVLIAYVDGAQYNSTIVCPEAGTYVMRVAENGAETNYVSCIEYNSFKQLDDKYISDTIARVSDISEHNTSEIAHSDIRAAIDDLNTLVGDTSVSEQIAEANMIYVGPTQPTDPNIKVWINTSEEGTGVVPVLPRISTITLAAANWIGSAEPYSQSVTLATVTASSKIDLQPTAQQIVNLQNAEVSLMIENQGGTVTCYAIGNKPTVDYTMQVLIQEVAYV